MATYEIYLKAVKYFIPDMSGIDIHTKKTPVLSVIMANYNGAAYLKSAVNCALEQTVQNVEIIVADDSSTDDSLNILNELQSQDARVVVLPTKKNAGPGDARNRAIKKAQGYWLAIVDADDLMHPHRFERLIKYADLLGADMVADDQICFTDDGMAERAPLFQPLLKKPVVSLSTAFFVESSIQGGGTRSLGFMKPLIKRESLKGLRYRTDIRIGEDFDFYLKYLASDVKAVLINEPLYFYRRHTGSISHRWSIKDIQAMMRCNDEFCDDFPKIDNETRQGLCARRKKLESALLFEVFIENLKSKRGSLIIKQLVAKPYLVLKVMKVLRDKIWPKPIALNSTVSKVALSVLEKETPLVSPQQLLQAAGLCDHFTNIPNVNKANLVNQS